MSTVFLLMLVTSSAGFAPHGTSVIALTAPDGLVMAADGLTLFVPDGANKVSASSIPPEPKIAVCGKRFLCGFAGYNPIDSGGFKYNFQNWISSIRVAGHPSVKEFTETVHLKARETFGEIKPILDADDFWKAKGNRGQAPFMSYGIIGYSEKIPEFCTFTLDINLENHTLKDSAVDCGTPTWSRTGTYRFARLPNSMTSHMELAESGLNVAEVRRKAQLIPQMSPIAASLFPEFPPSIQNLIAIGAALIKVEGEFNPKYVGGTTAIGVIEDGKLPVVAQFVAK
jgi:hypothetical protein